MWITSMGNQKAAGGRGVSQNAGILVVLVYTELKFILIRCLFNIDILQL